MPSIDEVVSHLESILAVPSNIDYSQDPPVLVRSLATDCTVLTCGCVISGDFASQLEVPNGVFVCPKCQAADVKTVCTCDAMNDTAKYLLKLKDSLAPAGTTASGSGATTPNGVLGTSAWTAALSPMAAQRASTRQSQPNMSFLAAFNDAFTEVNSMNTFHAKSSLDSATSLSKDRRPSSLEDAPGMITGSPSSNNSVSSSVRSIQKQKTRASFQSSNLTRMLTGDKKKQQQQQQQQQQHSFPLSDDDSCSPNAILNSGNSGKEQIFAKNFPFFRKLYQYHIHHSKFFPKSKLFINTALSPKLTRLALLMERKWEVYAISPEHPEQPPQQICCGKNNGDYGPSFESQQSVSRDEIVKNSNFGDTALSSLEFLSNWEHLSCRLTESLLVIAGTRGFLRIIDLLGDGRCLYTYQCKFPIRAIAVSPDERYVALGVTGKDKYTLVEQAFVILLRLDFNEELVSPSTSNTSNSINKSIASILLPVTSSASNTSSSTSTSRTLRQERRRVLRLTPYPFNLPYRDPISHIEFSPNSKLLTVATALESRFLAINITDPSRPVLVMKSQRRLDTSMDSEGITDMGFFPDNRLMSLTSVAYNSVPIIIDTNITSISGPEGIAHPKLLLKVEEVGTNIHQCAVSPRGDAVAYLDRSGTVYIMMCPKMGDSDNKRVVVVTDVANSYMVREAASIRFDSSGYKLYILDRKGLLSIADFTAGTVEDQSVTRCKIIY